MRLILASFFLLSICLGAEPLPRIAILPAMVFQAHGHRSQSEGVQGLNRRVAAKLLQEYQCQIVSRSNMLVFDQERVIQSLQERSPDFAAVPVAADFVVLSFLERQSGALRLHFAPVTEGMTLSKPLFIPKGDPDELLSEVPATITKWIASNLRLKPKAKAPDERSNKMHQSKRVWAVLPTDAPSQFAGVYNDPNNAQSVFHGLELAVAEADPEATMLDRTAMNTVIREWNLEALQGSHQHSLAAHVLGANVAVQAVVSSPNTKDDVRFDLIAVDPLTGTILAARTGEKNKDSLGLKAFTKSIASLLGEVSHADLPALRKERSGDDERRQHESLLHFKQASLPSSVLERVIVGGSGRLINAECAASLVRPRTLEELKRIGHLAGFLHPLTGWETSKISDHAFPRLMLSDMDPKGEKGAAYQVRLDSLFEAVSARLLALDTPESRAEAAKVQSNLANYKEALRISEADRSAAIEADPKKASLLTFISAKALIGLGQYSEAIKVIEEGPPPSVDAILMMSDCHRMLEDPEREHEALELGATKMQTAHRWYQERRMSLKLQTGQFESLINSHRGQLASGTATMTNFVDLYVQALLKTGDKQAAADVCNSMLLCPAYFKNKNVQKRYSELLAESGGKKVEALPLPSDINPIGKEFAIELYPLGEIAEASRLPKMAARIAEVWGCEVHLHKTMPMPTKAPIFDVRRNQFKGRYFLAAAAVALPAPKDNTILRLFYTEGLPLKGNTGDTAGDALGMILSGTAFLDRGYRTVDLETTNEICAAVLVGTQLSHHIHLTHAEMLEKHFGAARLPNVTPGVFSNRYWQSDPNAPYIINRLSLPTARIYKQIDWKKVSEKTRSRYMFIKNQFTADVHAEYAAIVKKAGVGTDPKVFSPKSAEADIND